MNPSDLIRQALEHGAARLRPHKGMSGLSQAYFELVLHLYGTDPSALRRAGGLAAGILRYGDDPSLGYRALGVAKRASGEWKASAEAFLRAGDVAQRPRDAFAFKTGAIDALSRTGRVDEAVALAIEIRDGLRALGEEGLAARASLNAGCALMNQDRYREAWSHLEGTADILQRHGFLWEAASTHLELSTSHLFGGDLARSREEARTALALSVEIGATYVGAVARGNLACIATLQGEADQALEPLLALRTEFEGAPIDLARTQEYLGDAYLRLNLWAEAEEAFRAALAAGGGLALIHRGHVLYGLGSALAAQGQPESALRVYRQALRTYRTLGNIAWQAAVQSQIAELTRSRVLAERAIGLVQSSESPYHQARAWLVHAELTGNPDSRTRARRLLKGGAYPGLEWRLHALEARQAAGRKALPPYRRMLACILLDRARTSSYSSRVAFLKDKTEALRNYLDVLLTLGSKRDLEEALSLIEQSRSVTLLDEVVAATGRSAEMAAQLDALRLEFAAEEGDSTGQRRPALRGHVPAKSWTDLSRLFSGATALLPSQRDTSVVVERQGKLGVLRGGSYLPLPMEVEELGRKVRWLDYDLLAPLLSPNEPATPVVRALQELGRCLIDPLRGSGRSLAICPDSTTWSVPWSALAAASDPEVELEIRLHPGMQGVLRGEGDSMLIWLAEHPDLPHAAQEAEFIQRLFPEATVCRTLQEARDSLTLTEISRLHVIAHSRLNGGNPMLSTIDFPDGPLFAAEIARAPARVGLVTLAACDTGRLSASHQEEPEGLVRAFLARGAGYIVGSSWTLDDESACQLFGVMYERLRAGDPLMDSLRRARQEVRAERPHPYFWAWPVVYGGYAG